MDVDADGVLDPLRGPGPGGAQTPKEFVQGLGALKIWYGDPSLTELQRRSGVPRSTLADALSPRRRTLPRLEVVKALLAACGANPEMRAQWVDRWRAIRLREVDGRGAAERAG